MDKFIKIPLDLLEREGIRMLMKQKRSKGIGIYLILILAMEQYRNTGISVDTLQRQVSRHVSQRDLMDILQNPALFRLDRRNRTVSYVDMIASRTHTDTSGDVGVPRGVPRGVCAGYLSQDKTERQTKEIIKEKPSLKDERFIRMALGYEV